LSPVLPPQFDPARAEDFGYDPDPGAVAAAARQWAGERRVVPAAADREHTLLLLVDVQKDFCFPQGSLFVAGRSGRGALDDNRRLATFLYRNLDRVSATVSTLDSHLPHHIFSPSFWVGRDGSPLEPHRTIAAADIERGEVRPRQELAGWAAGGDYAWLERQVLDYCVQLERRGRYQLYLWPPHCLIGSGGHTMVGVVQEARLFHAYARHAEAAIAVKGTSVLTEHYSVLAPEIDTAHDGTPLGEARSGLAERLMSADRLVIAGQASSHCVKNTIEDLLRWIEERDRSLARRVYVLEDCMSAVAVADSSRPGHFLADFTDAAQATLDRCREAGVSVVQSTVAMEEWPPLESARAS
jgi:nicotinamidase-related amidase